MRDYIKPNRLRRVVLITTLLETSGENIDFTHMNQDSIDDLLHFALRSKFKHSRPPLRTNALIPTLFQDNENKGSRDHLH